MAVALSAVFGSMAAHGEEGGDAADALKLPTNTIELSTVTVNEASAKFGEYNGLQDKGTRLNGSANLKGGDGYTDNEKGGVYRWSLKAADLGLSNRSLQLSTSRVGVWTLSAAYDELVHNLSDSYQTPYVGTNGGSLFTLPTGFGLVSTSGAGTNNLNATQRGAFHNLDISTRRQNASLMGATVITPQLSLNVDFSRMNQSGAKLQGIGSAAVGVGSPVAALGGEAVTVLPMPTRYQTDGLNVALNWTGDDAYWTAAYAGSFFHDDNEKMGYVPSMVTGMSQAVQYVATAPSNSLNQLTFSGGYKLRQETKLAGSLSWSRNTQDAPYVDPGSWPSGLMITTAPAASLTGKVFNTHTDLRLTDQSLKGLTLGAAFRYDQRDNQTASNIYNFYAIDGSHAASYPNTPMSLRKQFIEVSADYRIQAGQSVRAAVSREELKRWCNNYAVNAGYPQGSNCVVATGSHDTKLDTGYRMKLGESSDLKLGYIYAVRNTDYDPYARAAFVSQNGSLTGPVPAAGNTTPAGQNAGDYPGFHPFFEASRREQTVKGMFNIGVTDALSLGLGGSFTHDAYGGDYGVQSGKRWSLDADGTLAYSDTGSVFSYVSAQQRQRELTDLQRYNTTPSANTLSATALVVPATASWTNKLTDRDVTIGAGLKEKGLMSGRLEVSGDLSYALGRTRYNTRLNYTAATSGGVTCDSTNTSGAVVIGSCGTLPDIRTLTAQLKLHGSYAIDKASTVNVAYMMQRMGAADYYYNGYQQGSTPSSLMATNQTPGHYHVNVIGLGYIRSF